MKLVNIQYKKYFLMFADLSTLTLAFLLSWIISEGLRHHFFPELANPTLLGKITGQPLVFVIPAFIIISFSWIWGHYTRFKPFWDEQYDIIKIVLLAITIDIIFLFVVKSHFSRIWIGVTVSLMLFLLPMGRVVAKKIMIKCGIWFTPTIIVGTGKNALEAAQTIESDSMMGHKVIGLIDLAETRETSEKTFSGYPVFPSIRSATETRQNLGNPYVVIALENSDEHQQFDHKISEWISACPNAMIVPPMLKLPLYGTEVVHVFRRETLLLRLQNNLSRPLPRFLKRTFDLLVAPTLLILLTPLFIYLIMKIRKDGGNAIFAHKRIGLGGKPFQCYKFRTMKPDAQAILDKLLQNNKILNEEWQRDHKLKNDPRITEIGKFLRQTSIDELPQLINVIKGEMSLVGPRPIVEEELEKYGTDQRYYLEARPGMTGIWQISGRNDTSYERRVELDTWYVRNWSLWYDVVILIKTIPEVFQQRGSY